MLEGSCAPPDDRLREAIQTPREELDCFVASLLAMTETGGPIAGQPRFGLVSYAEAWQIEGSRSRSDP
jgi:hypothetical protein